MTAPYHVVDPDRMHESIFSAYAELLHGVRSGFDGIVMTEHSQSSYDVSPNPTLLASAVACAAQAEGFDPAIAILGRSLGKTREPLKIAEEYALLDCISGGRLIAGFPVGLSYDANLNASLPAIETRDRAGNRERARSRVSIAGGGALRFASYPTGRTMSHQQFQRLAGLAERTGRCAGSPRCTHTEASGSARTWSFEI